MVRSPEEPPNLFPPSYRDRFFDKPLPSSEDSERVILGAILLDNELISSVASELEVEDFYSPLNRRVFAAMIVLLNSSKKIDPITIGEELKKEGSIESFGGAAELLKLMHGIPHLPNVDEYITIVRDKSTLRKLVRACGAIQSNALAEEDQVSQILEAAETAVYHVTDPVSQIISVPASLAVDTSIEQARARARAGTSVVGIPTGFTDLDVKLQGLKNQYIVMAARPSMGKTSLLTQALYKASTRSDVATILFSIEMAKEEISDRIICAEAGIDTYSFRAGHLSAEEWSAAESIRDQMRLSDFYINDKPAISTRHIRAEVRRVNSLLKRKGKKLKIIGVDHVGLVKNSEDIRGRAREREVSVISQELKEIGREYDCAVIALSQLNRQSETRSGDHRPLMSDLRESGSLEQDADIVLLLYRPDYYQRDATLFTNMAEVIIAKNRNGPLGSVQLHFTRKTTGFSNQDTRTVGLTQQGEFRL